MFVVIDNMKTIQSLKFKKMLHYADVFILRRNTTEIVI